LKVTHYLITTAILAKVSMLSSLNHKRHCEGTDEAIPLRFLVSLGMTHGVRLLHPYAFAMTSRNVTYLI